MNLKRTAATEPVEAQITLFASETPDAFRKAVQVVHSTPQSPISLLQRRMANQWIKNALETKPDAEGWYTIEIREMLPNIGYDSNNRKHIIQSARELMKIMFDWDVIAPANKRVLWKASVLFPEVEMEPHRIRYQISKQVRERILDPNMYAVIDMNVVRRLSRASSIALYENCVRYEKIGHTAELPWTTFRDIILGKSDKKDPYPEYKHFKDKVLKPCIAEIGSKSDITLDLKEKRVGRSVTTIYFDVAKKEGAGQEEVDDEQHLHAVAEMVRLGVPGSEARKLLKETSLERVRAAIEFTRKRMADHKRDKLDNPAAYFRSALQQGWATPRDATGRKAKAQPAGPDTELEDQYALHRAAEAENYFKELDAGDQATLIDKYNAQQQVAQLRVGKKSTKAATNRFFTWLAQDTWGEATAEALLAFAKQRLKKLV